MSTVRVSTWLRLVELLFLVMVVTPLLAQAPSATTTDLNKSDPGGADLRTWLGGKATYSASEVAANFTWTLLTAALVWFMQAGFAFLGGGALRSKNQVNYWTKSYIDFSVGIVIYMLVGFAIHFGGSAGVAPLGMGDKIPGMEQGNAFIGTSGFAFLGAAYDTRTITLMIFESVFAATAVTIVAGMVAERLKFQAYLIYSILINVLIYPVYGHWVWSSNGWLQNLSVYLPWLNSWKLATDLPVGARDFAGSGVVHLVGGFVGLAGALLVGPRIGKYGPDGKPTVFPGHNIPYVVAGTFILFLGWFGFNPGSTLASTDYRISVIFINTYLAGGMAATVMAYYSYFRTGKSDPMLICNGALGGLVAITAPCSYVPPWAALVIGAIAGWLVFKGNLFVEEKLKIDDPVGAFGVHGVNGVFGLLTVGIFSDGTYGVSGLIEGNWGQLIAQVINVGVAIAFTFGVGLLIFGFIKVTFGLRVTAEEELEGLDLGEHGYSAYHEFPAS